MHDVQPRTRPTLPCRSGLVDSVAEFCGRREQAGTQAAIAGGLANRFGDHCGAALLLFGACRGRGCCSPSPTRFDSQQRAHRQLAFARKLALRVARNLGALRYPLVRAHRRTWIRSATGRSFLSSLSGADSSVKLDCGTGGCGLADFHRGDVFLFLRLAASGTN